MTRNLTWRDFLSSPDPNVDPDYPRRAAFAYPSIVKYQSQDRRLLINTGYGDEPFTVEVACEWAEVRAREELGS